MLTDIAVVDLGSVVAEPGSRVTSQSSIIWNVHLVAEAGEVVGKVVPHVLDRVDLGVFHPVTVLIGRVYPEGEPV